VLIDESANYEFIRTSEAVREANSRILLRQFWNRAPGRLLGPRDQRRAPAQLPARTT